MNTVKQSRTDVSTNDISDDADTENSISEYLQSHPDFFERHQNLLGNLKLPHSTGGPAVSLVERQVSVLRQENLNLERKLHDLIDVARSNDQLAERIHSLALELMAADNRKDIAMLLEEQLRTNFNADRSVLVLFKPNGEDEQTLSDNGTFLRILDREDSAISPFKTFMQSKAPRCGRVRDAQRNYLFGEDDAEIGSVALVPIGEKSGLGFLAIGSRSADHFHPGKSIDFLIRLGELITGALRRH